MDEMLHSKADLLYICVLYFTIIYYPYLMEFDDRKKKIGPQN